MYQPIIKDGCFLVHAEWLKSRCKSRMERNAGSEGTRITLNEWYNRGAEILGFGPGGYTEAESELGSDAEQPELNDTTQRRAIGGVTSAAETACGLRSGQASEYLSEAGRDSHGKRWFWLTPESVQKNRDIEDTITDIGFDFWDSRLMPGGPVRLGGHDRFSLRQKTGYLVPDGTMLAAIDTVLSRLRCPRPWRVTDYRGETKNKPYRDDRISYGIIPDAHNSQNDFSGADAFKRFAQARSVDPSWFVELDTLNDEMTDNSYSRAAPLDVADDWLSSGFAEAIARLQAFAEEIDTHYTADFRPAIPFLESARYASWVLRLIHEASDFLVADDLVQITVEAQPYVKQLAVIYGAEYPGQPAFYWPPNAVTLPGGTEGSRIAIKRAAKHRNAPRLTARDRE